MSETLTPQDFAAKWRASTLKETAQYQSHFDDLCRMLGHPTPTELDPTGERFTFQKGVIKDLAAAPSEPRASASGTDDRSLTVAARRESRLAHGFADVWFKDHFGWEYKGKHKDLEKARGQLLQYLDDLENPELLVVCDFERYEIHTRFNNCPRTVHCFTNDDIPKPETLQKLHALFENPAFFKPNKTVQAVTEEVAKHFATLSDSLRSRGVEAHPAAHFLMKLLFCLFAEDTRLLPPETLTDVARMAVGRPKPSEPRASASGGDRSLTVAARRTGQQQRKDENGGEYFARQMKALFQAMRRGGEFWGKPIDHFDGGLFEDDQTQELTDADLETIYDCCREDWSSVEPSIFGTLFERSLDPDKRSQIGAHYTSRADIELLVEPVLMTPLRREWEEVKKQARAKLERRNAAKGKQRAKRDKELRKLLEDFAHRISQVRVLDPACGSGNFLYVSLRMLKDLEKEVFTLAGKCGFRGEITRYVGPEQLHGIEINPYAAELARIVVWIGHIQWDKDNGLYRTEVPILKPLENIKEMDAILAFSEPRASDSEPRASASGTDGRSLTVAARKSEPRASGSEPRASASGEERPYPFAYFITFGCYGHRLHGDPASSVDRHHNLPGAPYLEPNVQRLKAERELMDQPPYVMDRARTAVVLKALQEVCEYRGWHVVAAHVRPTHVHAVVHAGKTAPEKVMNDFKAYSSRALNAAGFENRARQRWERHGSTRYLWKIKDVEAAIHYVMREQGEPTAAQESSTLFPAPDAVAKVEAAYRSLTVAARKSEPRASGSEPRASGSEPRASASGTDDRSLTVAARTSEPRWPECDVIVGNPPFLGGKLMRRQLGDEYMDALFALYQDRVSHEADLCCYWFEKARQHIKEGKCKRAGLLATQGIRGGKNREVLKRIKETGDIFFAVSDREWFLDGANVHISMVGFDDGTEKERVLDGRPCSAVTPQLAPHASLHAAAILCDNEGASFMGITPAGPFDLPFEEGLRLMRSPNPTGLPSSDVVRPYLNGMDLNKRRRHQWTVDFGVDTSLEEAARYEAPMQFVSAKVKDIRAANKREAYAEKWWLYAETRPAMRRAFASHARYLATCMVAKYRIYVWLPTVVLPANVVIVFARSDDYFFGVLHSRFHEVWALKLGTRLETRPRYTPTTCFETFPLPKLETVSENDRSLTVAARKDTVAARKLHDTIAAAAKELDTLRNNWLNPPEWMKEEVLEFPGTVGGPWARYIVLSRDYRSPSRDRKGAVNDGPLADARGSEADARGSEADARGPEADARGPEADARGPEIGLVRYPRIVPLDPDCAEKLAKRTLTNLYNERPTWLDLAHRKLDEAVAAAYGWPADLGDEEILKRLLELNQERAKG